MKVEVRPSEREIEGMLYDVKPPECVSKEFVLEYFLRQLREMQIWFWGSEVALNYGDDLTIKFTLEALVEDTIQDVYSVEHVDREELGTLLAVRIALRRALKRLDEVVESDDFLQKMGLV